MKKVCAACGASIDLPLEPEEDAACPHCGARSYSRPYPGDPDRVPRPEVANSLASESDAGQREVRESLEQALAEFDEEIAGAEQQVDAAKSAERGAPLQLGCALFGMFGFVVLVLAFFVTVGRAYFAGWLFYTTLTLVVLLSIARLRTKLIGTRELLKMRQRRAEMEEALALMKLERDRITNLLAGER